MRMTRQEIFPSILFFVYNDASGVYEEQKLSCVHLCKTVGSTRSKDSLPGVPPFVRDVYQYQQDGRVSKIAEDNYAAVLTSEANFIYNAADESIRVNYTYSNGQGFEYEFFVQQQ